MGKLSEPTTLLEWQIFFLKKKEGTVSKVISTPHQGIYKACETEEVLVMMHMTIVFFAFKFGFKGVYNYKCHKAVEYILEKG